MTTSLGTATPTPSPTATSTLPHTQQQAQHTGKLLALGQIIRLAAFAAEAREYLHQLDSMARAMPDVANCLSACIQTPLEWTQHPDSTPSVLRTLADELDALTEQAQTRIETLIQELDQASAAATETTGGAA